MFGSVQSTRPHASVSQQVEVRSDLARSDAACDVIKLNVGGVKHETTLATLTAIPDTYFTTLFCEASIYRGEVFVDRQGKYFEHILQYLRTRRYKQAYYLPELLQRDALDALALEAEFYNFLDLHHYLRQTLRTPSPLFEYKFLYKDYHTCWHTHEKEPYDEWEKT
ncbi:hypothetical protein WJX79_010761 [Trebouxia sp. C0005]